MKSILVSSVGVTARIEASEATLDNMLSDKFTTHYLPDASFGIGSPDVEIISIANQKRISKVDFPRIYLQGGLDGRSFTVAAEYMLERARQEKYGICTLNSSSVQRDGQGVIFYGAASNLGKSTFALDLRDIGFNHYSDEKTLIDLEKGKLVGGTRSIPLRKKQLRERLDEVDSDGFRSIELPESSQEPKAAIFVLPHYDNGLWKPRVDRLEDLDLFWGLSGEFSRRIRGTSRYINKFTYQLPSLDTEDLTEWRVKALRQLAANSKGFYFQGNSKQLVEFVNKEMQL